MTLNPKIVEKLKRHASTGGKSFTVLPGDSFDLSYDTACVYLLDSRGLVLETLLETKAGENVEDAADFLSQQVWHAQNPSDRLQAGGVRGLSEGPMIVITYFDGLCEEDKKTIESKICSLTRFAFHMGSDANFQEGLI